tara:strand:+ start:181 stop:1257 length:1077 start_codon:yes stop_codon:yes gene_type:complete
MPSFDIVKESEPIKTFRVASIIGKFDLATNKVKEVFTGNIDLPNKWSVGLIVGASGTGKTTIAKELFSNSYIKNYTYNSESIIDDMPKECSVDDITKVFNSVGFSSPPSWLKSYSCLSNGQKMRVDLANALLRKEKLVVFDEFTSVVDRNVAKVGSYAVQKSIRKTQKKFIAVTCHDDVKEWLLPDWIFNTDSMTFQNFEGQKKNRPELQFAIFETKNKSIWKLFAKHHYLNKSHNNAAKVFVAYINEKIAGFISVIHQPHARCKNLKRIHRLVVMPDYQGIGIGIKLLEFIACKYKKENWRISIVTSSPSLIWSLSKNKTWRLSNIGRKSKGNGVVHGRSTTSSHSALRITASFEKK